MEAIIEQVTNLTPESRKKLMITLRDLAYSLEEPDDTFHRLAYLVSLNAHSWQWYIMTESVATSCTNASYSL